VDLWIDSDNRLRISGVRDPSTGALTAAATITGGALTVAATGAATNAGAITFTADPAVTGDYIADLTEAVTLARGTLYRLEAVIAIGAAQLKHEFHAYAGYYAPQGEGTFARLSRARHYVGAINVSLGLNADRDLADGTDNLAIAAAKVRLIDAKIARLATDSYEWSAAPADGDDGFDELVDLASHLLAVELAALWPGQSAEVRASIVAERDRLWAEIGDVLRTHTDSDGTSWLPTGVVTLETEPAYPWQPDYPRWNTN
jgi:hypothetical protein